MPLLGQPAIRRFHRASDGILSGVDGLARAKADLAHGEAQSGDRLKALVAIYPHNEEVRSLLAEAYRRDRQWPQAGRWGYLIGPAATERERCAFESHSDFGWYPRSTEARLRRLLHVDDLATIADQTGRALLRDLPRKRNPLRKEGLVATIGRHLATSPPAARGRSGIKSQCNR